LSSRLSRFSPAFLALLPVLAVIWHAWLAVSATTRESMTSDEIAHLTAGHAYNTRGDFRLQPENGNLPQRWAALPLSMARAPLPPTDRKDWRESDVWDYGHAFFYEQGLPADEYLWAGRAMIALFSAATGLLIFYWSKSLWGERGAWLSLVLFVFCPNVLAHGALATSDACMMFFFLAAVGAWWRHLQRPGLPGGILSATVFGLAFVAKFSALLLLPIHALIAVCWVAGKTREEGWRRPLLRVIRSGVLHAAAAWAIIWLFYGFRYSAFAPDLAAGATFSHDWDWVLSGLGALGAVIARFRTWHVLPEAWLHGLAFVVKFSKARGAFLNGEYSVFGWVRFFPYAFLVKTPLPFLLLLAAGLFAATRRVVELRRTVGAGAVAARLKPLLPLAVLFGVYWVISLMSHLNIGHRHILPIYPVLFIAAGWLARWLDRRHFVAAVVIVTLLGWDVVESWRIRPHYLAYFNQLAGGPANGWRHLVDSSLDWGQDLPGLAQWLQKNNSGPDRVPVYLAYFGTGAPEYEGINATMLPTLPEVGLARNRPWTRLGPGLYCLSATMLQHAYSSVRGDWTAALEQEYQALRANEQLFLASGPNGPPPAGLTAEKWKSAWKRYEVLRFARLCHYLRARPADAMIGYSILIYRVNSAELDAALNRNYSALRDAIEKFNARQ
jgi:Dolichyl-phosphate-mannose-protein mannosyltransferase